jgi:hypothetical protein
MHLKTNPAFAGLFLLGYGGIGESELPSPEKLLCNLLFIISSLYITADTPKTKKSTAALRSPQAHQRPLKNAKANGALSINS